MSGAVEFAWPVEFADIEDGFKAFRTFCPDVQMRCKSCKSGTLMHGKGTDRPNDSWGCFSCGSNFLRKHLLDQPKLYQQMFYIYFRQENWDPPVKLVSMSNGVISYTASAPMTMEEHKAYVFKGIQHAREKIRKGQ